MIFYYLIEILVRNRGGFIPFFNKSRKHKGFSSKLSSLIIRIFLDKHNSYIGKKANISDSVVFPHGIRGIFISGDAIIGDNCVIFHQVTIGSNTIPDSKTFGAPTIGKNCYIGAGTKIIGRITIGDNCRIGANCIVTGDVPEDSLVIMAPPKIVSKPESDNHYYFINAEGEWGYYENCRFYLIEDPELLMKMQSYNKRLRL